MSTILSILHEHGSAELKKFKLHSDFVPAGDQPTAIAQLISGINNDEKNQVLLGVTGSGKTFTMAHVINHVQRPALIMAPNKTLAAQLYAEMKEFFPQNAVEYFVSYYDYYQPEAYVPRTDTYIEKTASINEQIDRMRHAATRALLERRDVIVVASVSCIYGIGSVSTYSEMTLTLKVGQLVEPKVVNRKLVELQYKRNDLGFNRGHFRLNGDILEIFPSHYCDHYWKISFFGDEIESIFEVDALTGDKISSLSHVVVFANSHYVTPGPTMQQAIKQIKTDLSIRLKELEQVDKILEKQRLEQRISFDIEMMVATGMCSGIENYSRYLTGKDPGEPPPTLFEYLPKDALLFIDESHVSVPQIGGMYKGDRARKLTLSDYGFRLPSCLDNRPLKFEEWDKFRPQTIFVSATPAPWELEQAGGIFIEQSIRPTGLIDPVCIVRSCEKQVDDLIAECREMVSKDLRILVTTLTKKMAEALSEYLNEAGLKVKYLHSDIDTLERIEIIQNLRRGTFDILVGINLLREGLDIPECGLVAILDADKEGFLRSKTSLVQTIGRAARNIEGRVILYADKITDSMRYALDETKRRRDKQQNYNEVHNITPESVKKSINDILQTVYATDTNKTSLQKEIRSTKELQKRRITLLKQMQSAAENLEFEMAAKLRDEIKQLEELELTY